jgi:molybdopterin-guanine dinucleotide biosynthesis protein MobB
VFRFGIDRLAEDPESIAGLPVGLLTHPAGVTSRLEPSWSALKAAGARLAMLLGPEHGIDGSAQDMESVGGRVHGETGLPVKSLYGSTARSLSPTAEDLAQIGVLVCDLQDVGARYYTFVWTICLAIEACAKVGRRVVVCDRPNPLGTDREGEPQKPGFLSFVGLHPVPVRHGMTAGEIARLYVQEKNLDVDLRVVPMEGWARQRGWPADLSWVAPSPNMPTLQTAGVYPGTCLLEATNLSEGRGTTRPFEQVGAPFLDAPRLAEVMNGRGLPGVRFSAARFRPAFQKHAGKDCQGVFLHVTDRNTFCPFVTGLVLLQAIRSAAPRQFRWRAEPYEFETRPAIDLLTGSEEFRKLLEAEGPIDSYCARQREVGPLCEDALLYPDSRPAVLGVSGPHDSGKTTLIEKLIPELRDRGLRVGAVKHTPHDVVDDVSGKDSYRLAEAGANPTAFVRPATATVRRMQQTNLTDVLERDFNDCDVVLVEGYKSLPLRRVEVGSGGRIVFEGRDFAQDLRGLTEAVLTAFRLDRA